MTPEGPAGGDRGDGGDSGSTRLDQAADGERVRGSLLWGLVGVLSFLVLVQGYELVGGQSVTVGVKAGVAVAVGAAAAGASYALAEWLAARHRSGDSG